MNSYFCTILTGIILLSCSGSRDRGFSSDHSWYISDIRDSGLLRDEIMRTIGSDSAGSQGAEHILRFEEGLAEIVSNYNDFVSSIGEEEILISKYTDFIDAYMRNPEITREVTVGSSRGQKQMDNGFMKKIEAYLKWNAAESKMMFQNGYNSFNLNNNPSDARTALGAGYVWLVSEWRRVDVPAILEKMRLARDYLKN